MKLVKYSEINENQYEDYIQEWESAKEEIVPSASKRQGKSFQESMAIWQVHETDVMFENGFVPSTLYYYINDKEKIIGAIHHRHELNKGLFQNGGHIGYGIRPTERGKGHAGAMLSVLLSQLWKEGYTKILITCDDDNIASAKTIEKNGGELMDKPVFEGTLTRRYWINAPKRIRNNDT